MKPAPIFIADQAMRLVELDEAFFSEMIFGDKTAVQVDQAVLSRINTQMRRNPDNYSRCLRGRTGRSVFIGHAPVIRFEEKAMVGL